GIGFVSGGCTWGRSGGLGRGAGCVGLFCCVGVAINSTTRSARRMVGLDLCLVIGHTARPEPAPEQRGPATRRSPGRPPGAEPGRDVMNLAFCYESVLPARGGCETYIAALARRLVADGHEVHLYACRWDAEALPANLHYHPIQLPPVPRFLRPWCFSIACARALRHADPQASIGFDKTWGQDILYPQGGLYRASAEHNLLKHRHPATRHLVQLLKLFDPTHWSYSLLERKQYLGTSRPLVIAISNMVRGHFQRHYGIGPEDLRVV